ncbi:MAG: D-glycero-beta-D-manno-heptose 1-phosphate adenylyltransferase [Saprospiraceae bacterium]|nr:D-glycero-beta-D-manno-heptose 1-phosphate adenylyltransferase [Saprospiraceae bacterium]
MLAQILNKIQPLNEAASIVGQWQTAGKKVIWTNGVFDLLHSGHIKYLCAARELGDYLAVGINSDVSVKRLKGEHRPINEQSARLLQMAALSMVDLVILFEEDTPRESILVLKPKLIVKGGDYLAAEVVGGEEAKEWGGKVVIIPFEPGHSSTRIIQKIQKLSHED